MKVVLVFVLAVSSVSVRLLNEQIPFHLLALFEVRRTLRKALCEEPLFVVRESSACRLWDLPFWDPLKASPQ